MSNIALIFAAGIGSRMNNATPKQYLKVSKKPILCHTIDIFEKSDKIDKILLIVSLDKIQHVKKLIKTFKYKKVIDVISGGNTALSSQFNGIKYLKEHNFKNNDIILIHDGVRPLINNNLIIKLINTAKAKGNAVTISNASETIGFSEATNKIEKVLPREKCFLVRAPQVFRLNDIYKAHIRANKDNLLFIDSASMMLHYKNKLNIIIGPIENIKVTTENDFVVCKYFLSRKMNG